MYLKSIGGVVLSGFEGKIVCSNTILNRIKLTFNSYLPNIKRVLFPDHGQ
ncbi:MAG: V-type ATP synthase subunit E family protein [bacterium]